MNLGQWKPENLNLIRFCWNKYISLLIVSVLKPILASRAIFNKMVYFRDAIYTFWGIPPR